MYQDRRQEAQSGVKLRDAAPLEPLIRARRGDKPIRISKGRKRSAVGHGEEIGRNQCEMGPFVIDQGYSKETMRYELESVSLRFGKRRTSGI